MEEFEKLMQLNSTEGAGSDTKDTQKDEKGEEPKQAVEADAYVPDQPTTSLEPYEPAQPTTSPMIPSKGGQTPTSPEAYEPDQPTPVEEVYTPDQPTCAVNDKTAKGPSLQDSDPYEPEQPTDEPMVLQDSGVSAKAKTEVSEVEADMPQLQLDSVTCSSDNHGQIEKGGDHATSEDTDATLAQNVFNNEGGNKSEQENLLPEEWLRKKEKKKKHSHGKHKKPLVEWRLGVLRKDYVIKDFKSFPVDEKLMATTKHKWNDESEVEHLKFLHSGDGSQTDTSEVSGMTSPAVAVSDNELESDQNTSGDINSIGRTPEENAPEEDGGINSSKDNDIQHVESKCLEGETKMEESGEVEKVLEESAPRENVKSDTGLEDTQPKGDNKIDGSSTVEKNEDLGTLKDGDAKKVQKGSDDKEETKTKSEKEEDNSSRMSTRQSSRRARRDSGENKTDADHKSDKKDDDSNRRRSRRSERYRDDSDDEKRKESDRSRTEADRTRNDTRRRSQRRDRYRDDSDDESREGRRRGRSDSRERRGRSGSRERRRYRDDDDRYDRYDRGRRQRRNDRRSMDRTDDRRSREDDRRNERSVSRERVDRRRKEKDDKEVKKDVDQTKEESKVTSEKKTHKADEREGDLLPGNSKADSKVTESDTVQEKDQNSKKDTSDKNAGRIPIKFNFTSRAVRRSTRSAVKAKSGVFEDDEDEDKPLSELQTLCDEKEPTASNTESEEDQAPPVTRSKSREGCPVDEPLEENKVGQLSSVHTEERNTTRARSSQNKENLFENTLRKEFKIDQESESDSGAELSLMGLGDAPSLYPENILESQVEMELLANAFSSTDTEAETEIVLDTTGESDNFVMEGKEEDDSPKQEESDDVDMDVDMEVEEQLHDASTIVVSSPPHIPDKEGSDTDVQLSNSPSPSPRENSRTGSEEMPLAPEEQTRSEIDGNEKQSQNGRLQENRDISIDETRIVPEIKIVPAPDESCYQVCSEKAEESTEEKESETNTSFETEQSDVESLSLAKTSDFSKTESESEDTMSMEIIDLMAGTSYKTSKISVNLPNEKSDVNTSIQNVSEKSADNDEETICDQTSTVMLPEEVTAVSQPAQPPISDSQDPDVNAETIVLDRSTSDQYTTVQEADEAKASSEVVVSDETIMPSIEIVNKFLPSEKGTIEVFNKESAMNHDELVEINIIPPSVIQSAQNADITTQMVPPISAESTEISSTQEPVIAVDEQPTKHVVQEGPVGSKRKRKSRWAAFVPEVPVKPPTLSQMDVSVVQTQQGDPSMINVSSNSVFQPKTEEHQIKEPRVEVNAPEETVKIHLEDQSVDSPKLEEETFSPSKRVRVHLDRMIVATADQLSHDNSTRNMTPDTWVTGKTEATYLTSGLDLEVNGAGDNQAMVHVSLT